MAIPRNLIPENISSRARELSSITDSGIPSLGTITSINGVPTNLIPSNASDIAKSVESIAGRTPEINAPEIPQYPILNAAIPDDLFSTGSIDEIRNRALAAAQTYVNGLPKINFQIPQLLPATPSFPPKRPSFAEIKNYVEARIDRIKLQKQKASVKALEETLKKKEDPFTYRNELINTATAQRSKLNTLIENQARQIINTGINQIRG